MTTATITAGEFMALLDMAKVEPLFAVLAAAINLGFKKGMEATHMPED